jgi:ABC-type sugar transport system permease subunit
MTAVVNAWGRYHGPLLVAPAIALLFLMNIFPLMWSFGLSFYNFRANREKAPLKFVGLDNYAKILTDEDVWHRLQTTAIVVILTVSVQMIVGFLLALLFERDFPGRRILLMLVLTPMMLSYVAVGAFFRYYYEPTFGLLSQAVRAFTGETFTPLDHHSEAARVRSGLRCTTTSPRGRSAPCCLNDRLPHSGSTLRSWTPKGRASVCVASRTRLRRCNWFHAEPMTSAGSGRRER